MSKPVRLPVGWHHKAIEALVEPSHPIDMTQQLTSLPQAQFADPRFRLAPLFPVSRKKKEDRKTRCEKGDGVKKILPPLAFDKPRGESHHECFVGYPLVS